LNCGEVYDQQIGEAGQGKRIQWFVMADAGKVTQT
jgi:hypothetical protein